MVGIGPQLQVRVGQVEGSGGEEGGDETGPDHVAHGLEGTQQFVQLVVVFAAAVVAGGRCPERSGDSDFFAVEGFAG